MVKQDHELSVPPPECIARRVDKQGRATVCCHLVSSYQNGGTWEEEEEYEDDKAVEYDLAERGTDTKPDAV